MKNVKISRIVKQKILVPNDVSFLKKDDRLLVKGLNGECEIDFDDSIDIQKEGASVCLVSNTITTSLLGTYCVLFKNAVNGVNVLYEKIINLYGVGYKVIQSQGYLEFFVGYSHTVKIIPPQEVLIEVVTPTQLIVKCCNKILLGDFVAKITKLRKVNPYKTKGVIEKGVFILKKEGKK